jgi:hypothetical protein
MTGVAIPKNSVGQYSKIYFHLYTTDSFCEYFDILLSHSKYLCILLDALVIIISASK